MMKPYLVEQLLGPDLAVLDETKPSELRQAVTPAGRRRSSPR